MTSERPPVDPLPATCVCGASPPRRPWTDGAGDDPCRDGNGNFREGHRYVGPPVDPLREALTPIAARVLRLDGGCESGHKPGQWHIHEKPYHRLGQQLAALARVASPAVPRPEGPNPCIVCGKPARAVVTVCGDHMHPERFEVEPDCGPLCIATGHHHDPERCEGCRSLMDAAFSSGAAAPRPEGLTYDAARMTHAWSILEATVVSRDGEIVPNPDRWEPDRYNAAAFVSALLREYARLSDTGDTP